MPAVRPQYTVYVIELDVDALAEKDRPPGGETAVYVGHSAHYPSLRLGQHQAAGERAARVFTKMTDPSRSWLRRFKLFDHPKKQNAFPVTAKQADYIIERVRIAAGEIDETA